MPFSDESIVVPDLENEELTTPEFSNEEIV
jgi:hypothetical protein